MGNSNDRDRLNGNLYFSNGSLADLEAHFLRKRIRDLQTYLDQNVPHDLDGESEWTPSYWSRFLQLEPHRCEAEMIANLLHDPKRTGTHLEEMLGDRLHCLNRSLARLNQTHRFDETYWETEVERHVVTKILNDWWRWLKLSPN